MSRELAVQLHVSCIGEGYNQNVSIFLKLVLPVLNTQRLDVLRKACPQFYCEEFIISNLFAYLIHLLATQKGRLRDA